MCPFYSEKKRPFLDSKVQERSLVFMSSHILICDGSRLDGVGGSTHFYCLYKGKFKFLTLMSPKGSIVETKPIALTFK